MELVGREKIERKYTNSEEDDADWVDIGKCKGAEEMECSDEDWVEIGDDDGKHRDA